MRPRTRATKLLDHPILNGVIALVVILSAVYISYFASNGVPFLPTYKLYANVPDAGKLTNHADVRIGGARIGQVVAITATPPQGTNPAYARLTLQISSGVRSLPVDSISEVRLASVLGGEYVQLTPGRSRSALPHGGVLPLAQAHPSVDLDDAFAVFGPPTKRAVRSLVGSFGTAVAGRGSNLNATFKASAQLLPPLDRVLAVLGSPSTNLAGFLRGLAATTGALAPVAGTLGDFIVNADTTLAAIDAAAGPLGRAIDELPPTEQVGTAVLGRLTPVLANAAALARGLQPGAALLATASVRLDAAVRASTPVARQIPALARSLGATLAAVGSFAADPAAQGALRVLGSNDLPTIGASALFGLGAVLRTVAPAQMACNVAGLWMRNLGAIATEGDAGGSWIRMIPILNSGQMLHQATPSSDLHVNFYPHENSQECEAGNEPYGPGQQIGNPPGLQPRAVELTSAPAAATRLAQQAGVLPPSASGP